jgi:poly(3-hydroxybutyrate) depolymerase
MKIPRTVILSAVVLAVVFLTPGTAEARSGGKLLKAPEVVEEVDGQFTKLSLKDDANAVGFLLKAFEAKEDKKYGLLVSLHGHGGKPKTLMFPGIAKKREFFVLGVQGHTPTGPGFAWNTSNKDYIAGLTLYVIEKYPVDRKRVLMTGHSAGGTLTLATYRYAPRLFAGIMTTAAPATPDSSHHAVRMVVFLGDQDPNYSNAGSVRSNFESKKRQAPGSLRIIIGLGHSLPDRFYMDQAVGWLLDAKARGWEVALPSAPPVKGDRPFAHILIRHAKAEGAGARAKRTSKTRAKGELKLIKKYIDKKLGNFLMEAAKFSHDDKTAASGGLVDAGGLEAFSPALKEAAEKLGKGETSEVIESPHGFHLIVRLAAQGDEQEK